MAKLRICYGDEVKLLDGKEGIVKYIGHTDFFPGRTWLGIELHTNDGKHDGKVRNRVYFNCQENHGIFVQSKEIAVVLKSKEIDKEIPLDELVYVNNYGKGRVRFVGQTMFDDTGIWYGIELLQRDKRAAKGNTDGTIDNIVYFKCENHCGVFVRSNQLRLVGMNKKKKKRKRKKDYSI
ncbi:hypothetical protein RFI_32650 [Reticulomyxa filosa]|uniref:CAP-Gly domain-containing protein n=1 Tax=Reticulomyxa filosa TaxID=46433 RepID=X6LS77_RETFI|nr:hypothetical protein RFI_32650 [Reticulomyxa filosa]|eukprot:ETO04748.1 hypothetical protein RFI_32650 [Reticulomyxa filosa]